MKRFFAAVFLATFSGNVLAGIAIKCKSKDGTIYKLVEDDMKMEVISPDGTTKNKEILDFSRVTAMSNPPSHYFSIVLEGGVGATLTNGSRPEHPMLRIDGKFHPCELL